MGKVRVAKLLISAGSDPFLVNASGQTALMRSVMFANNYDVRKFAELFELLHRTTLNIDNHNRTVFHHIVDLAMTKGKTHAARYYMETALARLSEYPKELSDIINFPDKEGETALTMAARCRSKRLVKVLLDHGSNPKIRNKEGKSAEDYILEDERFRSSPTIASRALLLSYDPSDNDPLSSPLTGDVLLPKSSHRTLQHIVTKFEDLVRSFEEEGRAQDRDHLQVKNILSKFEVEMTESEKRLDELKVQAADVDAHKELLFKLEADSRNYLNKRRKIGWDRWLKVEEEREKRLWTTKFATPDTISFLSPEVLRGGKKGKKEDDVTDIAELYDNLPTTQYELDGVCAGLRAEVEKLSRDHSALLEEFSSIQGFAGTSVRMTDYRKLLSAALKDVRAEDLDDLVEEMVEV